MAAYGAALVALFAASVGYHLLRVSDRRRNVLRRIDHVMIFVYMAAAYAPFCSYVVHGRLGWIVLSMSWAGAAAGIGAKLLAFQRSRIVSGALYILIGWLAIVTLPEAVQRLDPPGLGLLAATGIFYTGGALVLFARRPDPLPHVFGYHEVWHAAVVLASACYFLVLWGLPAGGSI